jgi:hypothetical protein
MLSQPSLHLPPLAATQPQATNGHIEREEQRGQE